MMDYISSSRDCEEANEYYTNKATFAFPLEVAKSKRNARMKKRNSSFDRDGAVLNQAFHFNSRASRHKL